MTPPSISNGWKQHADLLEMKYTVLTYIFGGNYERVHEVKVKDPNADYILVTDDPTLTSKTWRVVLATELDGLSPSRQAMP